MGADFDINSLLDTDFTKQLMEKASSEASSKTTELSKQDKAELIKKDTEKLQEVLVKGALENINKLDNILDEAFSDAASAPTDPDMIDSLAKLINARAKLMGSLEKVYLNKDKFKQNLCLTKMRLDAQYQMNQENNETKITLTRDAVLRELMKESKKDTVVEIRDNARIHETHNRLTAFPTAFLNS